MYPSGNLLTHSLTYSSANTCSYSPSRCSYEEETRPLIRVAVAPLRSPRCTCRGDNQVTFTRPLGRARCVTLQGCTYNGLPTMALLTMLLPLWLYLLWLYLLWVYLLWLYLLWLRLLWSFSQGGAHAGLLVYWLHSPWPPLPWLHLPWLHSLWLHSPWLPLPGDAHGGLLAVLPPVRATGADGLGLAPRATSHRRGLVHDRVRRGLALL